MSNYSIPDAGPTTLGPTDIFQRFCRECSGFDVDKSKVDTKTCNHGLRMLPEQLAIYEILQGLWQAPSNFHISPLDTILPASSVSPTSAHHTPPSPSSIHIPLPESGEEREGEGEEEGGPEDDAHVVEPQAASEHEENNRRDDWGAFPPRLRTRSGRATFLRGEAARPPSTIGDEVSTRESSPSVATVDEDGDYSTDSEADGAFEEVDCEDDNPNISDGEVTGNTAEGTPASEGVGQSTTESKEDCDSDTEEDEDEAAPTLLGSRNRPKRAREVWETKRGKPMVPATADDLAGYPAPADVFQTILNSGKSWVKAANATFPMEQQVVTTKRHGKEDWECRMKLAIPRTGNVCWVYNPIPCPKALNRDGYLRHLLDSHLGVERASGGSTRQDQIKKALKRCIAASAATRRGKRDREDDSEPGPSRKRMRGN